MFSVRPELRKRGTGAASSRVININSSKAAWFDGRQEEVPPRAPPIRWHGQHELLSWVLALPRCVHALFVLACLGLGLSLGFVSSALSDPSPEGPTGTHTLCCAALLLCSISGFALLLAGLVLEEVQSLVGALILSTLSALIMPLSCPYTRGFRGDYTTVVCAYLGVANQAACAWLGLVRSWRRTPAAWLPCGASRTR